MANPKHLAMVQNYEIEAWKEWRLVKLEAGKGWRSDNTKPDLRGANLAGKNLNGWDLSDANLSGANLSKAGLSRTQLINANLRGANLTKADLHEAHLYRANLRKACMYGADLRLTELQEANLQYADLRKANMSRSDLSLANCFGADLRWANLIQSSLIGTNLEKAIITGTSVYGISVWNVRLKGAVQSDLVITPEDQPSITVDNLEVAQFIYLLLNNEKIRQVIDTVTSKVVLILGRFKPERKAVLNALREELRKYDFLPVLFDFDKPLNRNLTETISTLAHMARFIIADITDAKSIPQELQRIVPDLPSVPVQPIIFSSKHKYGMFKDFSDYPWVLSLYQYKSISSLLSSLREKVIAPVVAKAKEIEARRNMT